VRPPNSWWRAVELALVYLVAALRQCQANLHHKPSNSNFGCAVLHISKIFAFPRNPIHGPGALFKGSEYEGRFHWYRLIIQAGEVRYGEKTNRAY
jgi:hypothetical protein